MHAPKESVSLHVSPPDAWCGQVVVSSPNGRASSSWRGEHSMQVCCRRAMWWWLWCVVVVAAPVNPCSTRLLPISFFLFAPICAMHASPMSDTKQEARKLMQQGERWKGRRYKIRTSHANGEPKSMPCPGCVHPVLVAVLSRFHDKTGQGARHRLLGQAVRFTDSRECFASKPTS